MMTSRKDQAKKDGLISVRKKHSDRLTPAPVWVIQRAGRRIFNRKQQRNWRETHLSEIMAKSEKHTAGLRLKKKQHKKNPSQLKSKRNHFK